MILLLPPPSLLLFQKMRLTSATLTFIPFVVSQSLSLGKPMPGFRQELKVLENMERRRLETKYRL